MAAINTYSAMSALDGTETFLGVQSTAKLATGQQLMTLITGSTSLTGATVTTSKPLLNHAQTWNDAAVTFTGWKLNVTSTASAAASLLLDLQVGAASKFKVDKLGSLAGVQNMMGFSSLDLVVDSYLFAGQNIMGVGATNSTTNWLVECAAQNLQVMNATMRLGWGSAAHGSGDGSALRTSFDTGLARAAATIVDVNNGTTGGGGALRLNEMTAPSAPATNKVVIYAVDNGAGKTQLMALFASGAAQQLAIEP